MQVISVDHRNNLFQIIDYYPQHLLDAVLQLDVIAMEGHEALGQDMSVSEGTLLRKQIILDSCQTSDELMTYSREEGQRELSEKVGQKLKFIAHSLWVDRAHYKITKHCDHDGIEVALQIYLGENITSLGTNFHNADGSIRKTFDYKSNSGYLMINGNGQEHSANFVVPVGTLRKSMYSYFTLGNATLVPIGGQSYDSYD